MEKSRSILVQGAVTAEFIAKKITAHQSKTDIGAHSIFLGQVRADISGGQQVLAIEYTCYEEMVKKIMARIRTDIFSKFQLSCMHVYHSMGKVLVGEVCLFIFTSSKRRGQAIQACNELVEYIKSELPIWGKEIFEDESYQWKCNV